MKDSLSLFQTPFGNFFFVQGDRRTSIKRNPSECVQNYLWRNGCIYSITDFNIEELTPIITIEPKNITELNTTHPELFL